MKMNRQVIESNIKEAREQLEEVEMSLSETLTEGELLVMLQHAYHHLNLAWNARRANICVTRPRLKIVKVSSFFKEKSIEIN